MNSFPYQIFQAGNVKFSDYTFHLSFSPDRDSFIPNNNDYKVVYEGEVLNDSDDHAKLEDFFYMFNVDHPQDFKGRSLSVSDIIKLNEKYYLCMPMGFKDITKEVALKRESV